MPSRRALLLLPLLAAAPVRAQGSWPLRPVRLVVPFPPGGTTDVLARAIAAKWQEAWGQQVVVDNQGGGGGVIGSTAVFRAPADGYTMILGTNLTQATMGSLIPNLPYDPAGFAAVTLVARAPHALVLSGTSPIRTVAELVEQGRLPGRGLSYASSSVGSASHLTAETFARRNGMNVTHVPYRGVAQPIQDLSAGTVDFMMTSWASVSALVQDGRLRVLAVGGAQRFAELPTVPTLQELGYGYVSEASWFGLFAPGGTPVAVLDRVHAATETALADVALRTRLEAAGFRIETMPPAAFSVFHRAEIVRWAAMVRESGVTIAN